jgi:hypothetical protein
MNPLTRRRLMDELFDVYVDWWEASRAVDGAYRSWSCASGTDAGVAFARHSLALDQEERAAEAYAGLVRRVEQRIARSSGLAREQPPSVWRARSK